MFVPGGSLGSRLWGSGKGSGPHGGKVRTDQDGAELPGWPQLPLGPRAHLITSTDQSRGAAVPGGGDPSPGAGRG